MFKLLNPSPIAPEGASCWICLEEDPDEKGGRLMRNCACRGEASGFAHASCVAQYWAKKLKKNPRGAQDVCTNCNQDYQGDMALAVATGRLEIYKEQEMPETDLIYLTTMVDVGEKRLDVEERGNSNSTRKSNTTILSFS